MRQEPVRVLIVGAGGAGLSLHLLLLQQGVPSLLIDRRAAISIYPRARMLNFRTLEVFRGLGLAAAVRSAGTRSSQAIFKASLADAEEKTRFDPSVLANGVEALSPDPFLWYCPQSQFEPLLLATAQQRGSDVRYNTELVSFTQDHEGVTATLRDRVTGRTFVLRSAYLVACDGAHSQIRTTLGISSQGLGWLPEYFLFVYFRSPWQRLIADHESDVFVIQNPAVQGIFVAGKGDLGVFGITYRPGQGETFEDFPQERCLELLRAALGTADLPIEIVDIVPWQPTERVADQFQQGRVFLVGDAAHAMPTYKGLGVNTAIASAQNLAWKLAAVSRGQASSQLLATYQQERHPVGRLAAQQSLTGPSAAWLPQNRHEEWLSREKELPLFYPIVGYRYCSPAICSEDEDVAEPEQDEIALLERQELNGLPGTRVPHLWLERQGERISTVDLLDGCFVLLTGPNGTPWCEAAAAVSASLGLPLSAYRIGSDVDLLDLEHDWPERLGISSEGVVLIRPDGYVAWRSKTLQATPALLLEQVFSHILCKPSDLYV